MTQWYRYSAATGEYEDSFPADLRPNGEEVTAYRNATTLQPPTVGEKQVAVWNGTAWEVLEDHRQKRDSGGVIIEDSGTAYWLPGDDWHTPARYMTEVGLLPDGANLVKPEKSPEEVTQENADAVRSERDKRISDTTWLIERHKEQNEAVLPTSLTPEQHNSLLVYRQALRDIPQQPGFPWHGVEDAPWPTKPENI